MNRLVIIDGHAILHRAYHALPPLTTSKGQPVNAIYGFISTLLRVIADFKPSYLIVVFDTPTPTFRNKLSKDYQAKRPKMDKSLADQIDAVHDVIKKMAIIYVEKDGYEGDDVIGTIVQKTKNKDIEIIIVTGDRDMLQLVDEDVKVYMPVKGLSQAKLYEEKDVVEKYGIEPEQVVDFKALTGDASDNYPGVSGIGPQTAKTLLLRFNTLDRIYQYLEKIDNEKLRQALIKGKKSAHLSRKLAAIVCDAPIDFNLEKCKLPSLDKMDVYLLFDELEFRSLIPRLAAKNKEPFDFAQGRQKTNKEQIKGNKQEKKESKQINLFNL